MKLLNIIKEKLINFIKFLTSSSGDAKSNLRKYLIYFIIVIIVNIIAGKNITHMGYPWYSNVSMFLLLNINIILVIVLLLLIFRNLVKILSEQRGTLKIKLLIFSLAVTILPVSIIFIYSSQLLTDEINKWYNRQVDSIVSKATVFIDDYRIHEQKQLNNYISFFSSYLDDNNLYNKNIIDNYISNICRYVYTDVLNDIVVFDSKGEIILKCNNTGNNYLLEKLLAYKQELLKDKYVYGFDDIGRGIHWGGSYSQNSNNGGFLIMQQTSKAVFDDLSGMQDDLKMYNQSLYFANPIKNSSILQLLQISLLLLFSSIWISTLFARSITKPIEELAKASKKISSGNFDVIVKGFTGGEIGDLVSAFNSMTTKLKEYTTELSSKNVVLSEMFEQISRDNTYIDAIFKNVDSSIMLLSNEMQILKSNIKADLFISKYRSIYNSLILEKVKDFMGSDKSEQTENIEVLDKDENKLFIMNLSKIVLREEEQVLILLGDVTDIVDAQKVALWKDIATRIAHEVKNPLTPIKLMAERVKRKADKMNDISSREVISESMDIIITEADNLKELIEEFNMFARLPKADKHDVNLLSLLKDTVSLYRETYSSIEFVVSCSPEIEILCDRLQLRRVFQNIISNAVYIIGNEKGIINIEVLEINDKIEIVIKDSGKGIDEKDIPNLFKPYFSKRQGGTGLGLAIVRKIVEEHSGTITAGNNVTGGAYFKILLPRGI